MSTNFSPQGPNGGTFDVVAYRADPTGSADSSTAVQAAMTAAQAFAASYGRATVKFPPGKYKLSSTVTCIGGNVTIDAYGAYIFAGSNNDLFRDWTSQDSSYTLNGIGLTILGGIWDLKGQNWGLGSNSTLNSTGFSGFTLSNSSNITFRDVTVRNVYDYHGVDLNSCRDVIFENCRFEGFKNNFTWLVDVVAATTANITLSAPQTVDGIAVTAGQRVLVKNQTTASQNGIYTCAAGSWVRATDNDASAEFNDVAVIVEGGTVNDNKAFYCATHNPTVGTTSITWTDTSSNAFHNESRKYSEAIQLDCGPNNVATINVTVQGCHMGPAIDGSGLGGFGKLVGSHTAPSTHYQNVRVIGNNIDSPLHAAVGSYEWDGSVIEGNTITSTANQACILVDTCIGTVVQGNSISQGATSNVMEGGWKGSLSTGQNLQDNAHCIKVTGTSADTVIVGNQCIGNDASAMGIQLQGGVRAKLIDNDIYQVGMMGIYISSAAVDTHVAGNTVTGASRRDGTKGAIAVSNNSGNIDWYIADNMIRKFGSGNEALNAIVIEGNSNAPVGRIGSNDFGQDWGQGFTPINFNTNAAAVAEIVDAGIVGVARLASDVTGSSTTAASITGLSTPIPALGKYKFTVFGQHQSSGTATNGVGFGITLPTTVISSFSYQVQTGTSGGATNNVQSVAGANANTTRSGAIGVANTSYGFQLEGFFEVSAAGTLQITYNVAGSTAKFMTGTVLTLERVA